MMIEKEEIVQCIKMLVSKLLQIKKEESFHNYKSLFKLVDDQILESLTQEERQVYLWFNIENNYYIRVKNKKIILDFLEGLDFKLETFNYLKENKFCKLYTDKIIKWIKLNLSDDDISEILNKAFLKTEKISDSFNVLDLGYLNINDQEHKFNIINLSRNYYDVYYDFYHDFGFDNDDIQDRYLTLIQTDFFQNMQQILFNDERFKNNSIEDFIKIYSASDETYLFLILCYTKENKKRYNELFKTLFTDMFDNINQVDDLLLSLNQELLEDLKMFKNIENPLMNLYTNMYVKLNKKEQFNMFFKESYKYDNSFILVPYSYLMDELTNTERERYIEKFNNINDNEPYLTSIIERILNPFDLIKLRLILSYKEGLNNIERLSLSKNDINIIKNGITKDFRISDDAYKLLKLNNTI